MTVAQRNVQVLPDETLTIYFANTVCLARQALHQGCPAVARDYLRRLLSYAKDSQSKLLPAGYAHAVIQALPLLRSLRGQKQGDELLAVAVRYFYQFITTRSCSDQQQLMALHSLLALLPFYIKSNAVGMTEAIPLATLLATMQKVLKGHLLARQTAHEQLPYLELLNRLQPFYQRYMDKVSAQHFYFSLADFLGLDRYQVKPFQQRQLLVKELEQLRIEAAHGRFNAIRQSLNGHVQMLLAMGATPEDDAELAEALSLLWSLQRTYACVQLPIIRHPNLRQLVAAFDTAEPVTQIENKPRLSGALLSTIDKLYQQLSITTSPTERHYLQHMIHQLWHCQHAHRLPYQPEFTTTNHILHDYYQRVLFATSLQIKLRKLQHYQQTHEKQKAQQLAQKIATQLGIDQTRWRQLKIMTLGSSTLMYHYLNRKFSKTYAIDFKLNKAGDIAHDLLLDKCLRFYRRQCAQPNFSPESRWHTEQALLAIMMALQYNKKPPMPNTVTQPELQKLLQKYFAAHAEFSADVNLEQTYKDDRGLIDKFIHQPYAEIKQPRQAAAVDKNFYQILLFLNTVYGRTFLRETIWPEYFQQATETVSNHQQRLDDFLQSAIDTFLEVQSADYVQAEQQIDEARLYATLVNAKKALNRWSEANNLTYALRRVPEYKCLYHYCTALLPKMPLGAKRTELQQIFLQQLSVPVSADDLPLLRKMVKEITDILAAEHIKFSLPRIYFEKVNRRETSAEKQAYRQKKQFWSRATLVPVLILSAGAFVLNAYAFLSLLPIFGAVAVILAVVSGGAAFLGTLRFFRGVTFATLKYFLYKRKKMNQDGTLSGKIFRYGFLGMVAIAMGVTMAFIIGLSFASLSVGSLGLAPWLAAPIVLTMAATAFFSFAAYMAVILSRINHKVCQLLQMAFPEIVTYGWGVTGLIRGVIAGLQRWHQQIKTPGVFSVLGGYRAAVMTLLDTCRAYWRNPTANPEASDKQILVKRLDLIFNSVIKPLCLAIAATLVFVAMVGKLYTSHGSIVTFLTTNPYLAIPFEAAKWLSIGIVCTLAGIGELILHATSIGYFMLKIAEGIVDNIYRPIVKLLTEPVQLMTEIGRGLQKKYAAARFFLQNVTTDPQRTLYHVGKTMTGMVMSAIGTFFYSIGNIALMFKAYLYRHGVIATKPSPREATLEDWADSTATFNSAAILHSLESVGAVNAKPLNTIPLAAVKQYQRERIHAQQLRKQSVCLARPPQRPAVVAKTPLPTATKPPISLADLQTALAQCQRVAEPVTPSCRPAAVSPALEPVWRPSLRVC